MGTLSWEGSSTILTFASLLIRGLPLKSGGWSGGAMVLCKHSVPGVILIWIKVGQGPTVLAVGAVGVCLDIFSLFYHSYLLSHCLREMA